MANQENVGDLISLPQLLDNITEMEHLKSNIDDVFLLSNGIIVCCELPNGFGLYNTLNMLNTDLIVGHTRMFETFFIIIQHVLMFYVLLTAHLEICV
jgi:hypothetical protein